MADPKQPKTPEKAARKPGPARLYVLIAGIGMALLGVLGFFYDSSFGTGNELASDDVAGILVVNGWRNVAYLVAGIVALALGPRFPRAVAFALGAFFLAVGLWGLAETDRGIGSLLDAMPIGDEDNALHLILGGTGLIAALADGGLPALPRKRRKRPGDGKRAGRTSRSGGEGRRRSPAALRGDGDA